MLSADAMHALRLMCTPGALAPTASITLTAFIAAVSPPPPEVSATSARHPAVSPSTSTTLQLALAAPGPTAQCEIGATTVQHCLALAELALALQTRCLQLRPVACSEVTPGVVLREVGEFMEHGTLELQVSSLRISTLDVTHGKTSQIEL